MVWSKNGSYVANTKLIHLVPRVMELLGFDNTRHDSWLVGALAFANHFDGLVVATHDDALHLAGIIRLMLKATGGRYGRLESEPFGGLFPKDLESGDE